MAIDVEHKIILPHYRSIIFDFDGVIVDSNKIKSVAIANATKGLLPDHLASNFVNYFTGNNGVPRKIKIEKYFSKMDSAIVLKKYEEELGCNLIDAPLIPGVKKFIYDIKDSYVDTSLFILSGGELSEILEILERHEMKDLFNGVYAAPYCKLENLQRMKLKSPALFFGDSKVDYLTAKEAGLDFVFVYGATDWEDWRSTLTACPAVPQIQDFRQVHI